MSEINIITSSIQSVKPKFFSELNFKERIYIAQINKEIQQAIKENQEPLLEEQQ